MARYNPEHLRHVRNHRLDKARAVAARVEIPACPPKPEGMAWRDYLILLLQIASELEHGLMVQYLYAAYSIGGEGVPEEDQALVRQWQELILTVAREEMGHLLTVQNLLLLVGGPVWFNRPDFPWDTPFYPFPFRLEPLSKESLACYIFAEMPHNFEYLESHRDDSIWGDRARHFIDHDVPFIKKTVKRWVEKDQAKPVGDVYQVILDIVANPECLADSDFRPESYPLQASWDDWGRGYRPRPEPPAGKAPPADTHRATVIIERAATRTEALYALREVMGQGEAAEFKTVSPGGGAGAGDAAPGGELSHFERFVAMFQDFEERASSPRWNPVRPVPLNPTTCQETGDLGSHEAAFQPTPITHPGSLKWALLFNLRYRMLLTYLNHSFRLARTVDEGQANLRGTVMHRVFAEMYNLKAVSGILVTLPLTEKPRDPRRAAPTFEMPHSIDLPGEDLDCWRLHRDLVTCSMALCDELLDPAQNLLASAPATGETYLRTLRNLDQDALSWVDTLIAGLRNTNGRRS
jgi:hypothetical protein